MSAGRIVVYILLAVIVTAEVVYLGALVYFVVCHVFWPCTGIDPPRPIPKCKPRPRHGSE